MAPPSNSKGAKKQDTWDPKIEPIMKHLLGSGGVRTRQAAEEGRRAVEYFRAKDFASWVAAHREVLIKQVPLCSDIFTAEESPAAAVAALGSLLIAGGFIYRATPVSVFGDSAPPSNGKGSISAAERDKQMKWPRKLQPTRHQSYDDSAFYVVRYEGSNVGRHAVLAIIILSVLVICMFPAWPLALKLAVWYVSVVLLTILLGLVVLRLVIFVLLWYFGIDFWLLPNLFNEDLGVIDSFIPGYIFDYRNDSWLMVGTRLFCLLISIAGIFQLGQTHSISDMQQFATRQFLDVLDWGHQKLSPPPDVAAFKSGVDPMTRVKPSNSPAAEDGGTAAADPEAAAAGEDEEDYSCLRKCGFETFDELMDECLTDCPCMQELVTSPCYRSCPDNVKQSMKEAKLDACADDTGAEQAPPAGDEL